jgi:hypothetical protein
VVISGYIQGYGMGKKIENCSEVYNMIIYILFVNNIHRYFIREI